uniref:Cathepsin propeptide inhibitor domain-containing protein n=1 Tax=Ananas comosus var. bracteatus TaxID=296719 RepID=A0A6V7QJG0_ANACO|nr:unnamed protein product [Ananas comosus var. bracteatus]
MGMKLLPIAEAPTTLEQRREREAIGEEPTLNQFNVELEGVSGQIVVGVGADDGVEGEGGGVGDLGEDEAGVVDGAEGRCGGDGDEAARGEWGEGERRAHHLGVDLLELRHGGALVEEECLFHLFFCVAIAGIMSTFWKALTERITGKATPDMGKITMKDDAELRRMHKKWMVKIGRRYANAEEEERRFPDLQADSGEV